MIDWGEEMAIKNIKEIAKSIGLNSADVFLYGDKFAKVENKRGEKNGKLILVSAMTSNKTGIGKTTISIGLADALHRTKHNVILALREPSLGPVFGIKGGATGGGKAKVEPSDEINLHFSGDFHAVAQANNLLSSIIDNHIFQGNELGIDCNKIFFKRCLDVNDRSLRSLEYKIGKQTIKTGFNITAASEVMAVLCLSEDLKSLKKNLGNILVALNKDGKPVYAKDLKAENSMAILLKDALKPNLVQTLEGTPALVHLGPFANIAHGCNSVTATKFALSHSDFCVTEAGFGSDLGAEKFFDIKSRVMKKCPDSVVLVVVCEVLKEQGNGDIVLGFENVKKHIQNLRECFNVPFVVAINKHKTDSKADLKMLQELCKKENAVVCVCEAFEKGGAGCEGLSRLVLDALDETTKVKFAYQISDSLKTKIEKIATKVYGAGSVSYSQLAEQKLALAKELGCEKFFVNIAKTQFSFSDNKDLLGAPKGFVFHITDIEIRSGAKMIVAVAGNILLMPGLSKTPNYLKMNIGDNEEITGLF